MMMKDTHMDKVVSGGEKAHDGRSGSIDPRFFLVCARVPE